LREAPQGRSDKMWSESTFVPNEWPQPLSSLEYTLAAVADYWEKKGASAIFFPSSSGLPNALWEGFRYHWNRFVR